MSSDQQPLHVKNASPRSTLPPEPLPERKKCTGYHVYKVLSIIYVLVFILIGLLLTGLAVWIIIIKQNYEAINDVVRLPLILLLVVGLISIFTAVTGCVGASCDRLWPLRIFLGIVILVFILQVVIGILAYVYREETIENFGHKISFAVTQYNDSSELKGAVDMAQRTWDCCGIEKADDWNNNPDYNCNNANAKYSCSVPDSCCVDETAGCGVRLRSDPKGKLNRQGCKQRFQEWVERNLDAIGATALAMAILHILGIFVVYMFITKIEDRIRLFKYRKRFYQ